MFVSVPKNDATIIKRLVVMVNGVEVKTVKELSEVIRSSTMSHVRFDLQGKKVVIIDLGHSEEMNASLLSASESVEEWS
ncbi:hypothetical protein Bca101_066513 [Brassica carinata]